MGIFSKLFGKKGKDESAEQPLEFKQAVDFNTKFFDLLKADTFIARSDYKHLTQEYQSTATFFENGKRAQTLTYYCTYYPSSKEEFMNLYGLGEYSYNTYGQIFINAIKEFQTTHKKEE